MTRTSPNRNSRSPLQRGIVAIVLAIVAILLLYVFYSTFSTLVWGANAPLLSVRTSMQGAVTWIEAPFASNANLIAQNQTVIAELASSTAALADRDALYQETLDLKDRLNRDGSVVTILASVLLRPPALPYDTLVVDAGSTQGVAMGDVVAASGTTLIGFISEVQSSISYVTLFSSPGQTYNALLNTSEGVVIPIVITGQGGGSLTGKVPAGTQVSSGDTISFPSISGGFIGAVSSVVAPANQSFETIYMHEPVNAEQLASVEIWKDHAQQ